MVNDEIDRLLHDKFWGVVNRLLKQRFGHELRMERSTSFGLWPEVRLSCSCGWTGTFKYEDALTTKNIDLGRMMEKHAEHFVGKLKLEE